MHRGDGGTAGSGGRCREFALAAAVYLQGAPGIWLLSAGTDGVDGSDDVAGAYVTPDCWAAARQQGLDAVRHLAQHDSGGFFARLGTHITTGPTFTNVNDFRAFVILPDDGG